MAQTDQLIEVSATIDAISYSLEIATHATPESQRTFSAVCTVGTNEWWISNDFPHGAVEYWHYDGTNVYSSLRTTNAATVAPPSLGNHGPSILSASSSISNLTIQVHASPDGHPMGNVGVNLPWLAFCSADYLKQYDRRIPLPVATLRNSPDRFGYADQTDLLPHGCGLPSKVDLLTSASLYEMSVRGFNQENFMEDRSVSSLSIPEGALKFHYAVTATTNVFGRALPLMFDFAQYHFAQDGSGRLRYRGSGRVTGTRAVSRPAGVFDATMQQTVVDWRFRDAEKQLGALTYISSNTFAPGTNDPVLISLFRAKSSTFPDPIAKRQRRARVVTAIVLCFATLVTVGLFRRGLANINNKPRK